MVYIASRWGEPSQTFVRREAQAVIDAGIVVTAASLKPPTACSPSVDVLHLGAVAIGCGALRTLIRRPFAVAAIVATVIRRSRPGNVAPQLVAALIGMAWVGCRRLPAGHLHAHFGWVAATATWAAAELDGRPFSVMVHAFEIHDRRYLDGFAPIPLRAARRVCVESEKDRLLMQQRWGLEATVIRLGVPTSWLEDSGTARCSDLIVTVGRLVPKKGHGILIDALALTSTKWKAEIIGDGPLRNELQEQIERLGLADRVRLHGPADTSEVQWWLRRASVSCLASVESRGGDRDGTPMALVEAMASGATVVATDVGAIAELVGEGGVVVEPASPRALAAALDAVADVSLRDGLARSARKRVATEWTSPISARTLLAAVTP